MNKLHYVGYYTLNKDKLSFPSAIAKMDYIIETLNSIDWCVDVISPCRLKRKKGKCVKGSVSNLNDKTRLIECGSIPERNIVWKLLQVIFSYFWLFFYVLIHLDKDDILLCYHTIGVEPVLFLAKMIKRFKIVMEVEEIFNDVAKQKKNKRREIKMIQKSDAFLYSTRLLDPVCNPTNKAFVVVQGSYVSKEEAKGKLFDSDVFHIVYAGVLREDKGVDVAINLARYLGAGFCVHIIGYGGDDDVHRVNGLVKNSNDKYDCKISFDGLITGEAYDRYIQSCDIGLCCQSDNVGYNETAFPSKIISYLSNGLPVISVKVKSIEESVVSELLKLYDNGPDASEKISNIIKRDGFVSTEEIRAHLKRLDLAFKRDLKALLNNIKSIG